MSAAVLDAGRATELRAAEFTYSEVGATRDQPLPAAYRTFTRTARIDSGATFASLRAELLRWDVQARSGIRVSASGDVAPEVVVELRIGVGPLSITAPCRVVYVVDEPARCGFAYGTLPGHPESGEELFLLESADGATNFTVAAFSRPATLISRLAGPIGPRVQDVMTTRYLRALQQRR